MFLSLSLSLVFLADSWAGIFAVWKPQQCGGFREAALLQVSAEDLRCTSTCTCTSSLCNGRISLHRLGNGKEYYLSTFQNIKKNSLVIWFRIEQHCPPRFLISYPGLNWALWEDVGYMFSGISWDARKLAWRLGYLKKNNNFTKAGYVYTVNWLVWRPHFLKPLLDIQLVDPKFGWSQPLIWFCGSHDFQLGAGPCYLFCGSQSVWLHRTWVWDNPDSDALAPFFQGCNPWLGRVQYPSFACRAIVFFSDIITSHCKWIMRLISGNWLRCA